MQLTYDTATFGSFTDSFLTSFRDEFSKLSILSFPLLSEAISKPLDLDDVSPVFPAFVPNNINS